MPPKFGRLILKSTDASAPAQVYQLRMGENIIGRAAPSTPPEVNVLIKTDDRSISRTHCKITISFGLNGWEHRLTNLTENSQTILKNDAHQQLEIVAGDDVFLQNQYVLILGDVELEFQIVQPDRPTNYQAPQK